MAANTILALTGSAPYLGGPSTWQPLREAAPDLAFRDFDLFDIPPGAGHIARLKSAISVASQGACAIVAHGLVATAVLETVRENALATPVLVLSPLLFTPRHNITTRIGRWLLRAGLGKLMVAASKAKLRKLIADRGCLRKELAVTVRESAITPNLVEEAHQRLSDPRMGAFISHFEDTMQLLLAPSNAFEHFSGTILFGTSPMDTKMHRNIPGTVLEDAWSAPMIETPDKVVEYLRPLLSL